MGVPFVYFKNGRMIARKASLHNVFGGVPSGARPDYSMAFDSMASAVVSYSHGMDIIHADSTNGRVSVPIGSWGSVMFSVGNVVGTPDPVISNEIGGWPGTDGDVFSYILPGSTGVYSGYVGQTYKALDSRLPGTFGMVALDVGTTMKLGDSAMKSAVTSYNTIYFTVDAARFGVPSSWLAGSSPSGGTIFQQTWDDATSSWGPVSPFLTYSQLMLGVADQIDALSVDEDDCQLIFSITNTSPSFTAISQLRYASWCTDGTTYVGNYENESGTATVASEAGTGETATGTGSKTDIISTCTEDPRELFSGGAPLNGATWPYAIGTPIEPTGVYNFGLPITLSASVFRHCTSTGVPTLRTFASGWPPGGEGSPNTMLFFIAVPGTSPLPLTSFRRDVGVGLWHVGGAPVWLDLPLGGRWGSTLNGVTVEMWWWSIGALLNTGTSPPLAIGF